jgi:signal transduction histidine kinase/ligand-binding sensor domain-containing protein
MRVAIALFFIIIIQAAGAQDYRFRMYRVEQGLPSDVVKAVSQDAQGFIWIATDDGLVKYDGIKFTTYKSALRSQYAKGFLQTREGRLFVIGDLDLVEIQNKIDTVIFTSVLKGGRTLTDSTISYPKTLFEDRHGSIWIAEPRSLVKLQDGKMKRYDFGDENRSPVFIRSFNFFEDDSRNLYVVSYSGKIFWFNRQKDEFVELKDSLPDECSHVVFNQGQLWLASGSGLYRASVTNRHIENVVRVLPIAKASHLLVADDASLWVSSYEEDLYHIKGNGDDFSWELLPHKFNGINSSYQSYEGDIWSCSDKGLVLLQKNLFVLADVYSQTHFIESVVSDPKTDAIYYCSKEEVVQLKTNDDGELSQTVVHKGPDNYFQSLQFGKRGLWASNSARIMLFKNNELDWEQDFSSEGNFIHDVFLDSYQNAWLSQSGNRNIIVVSDLLMVRRYPIPTASRSEINVIREGRTGMYAGASGKEGYLFFKPNSGDEFTNISVPVDFETQGDFNIYDLDIQTNVVWLASTEGLLRYEDKKIERIDLGDAYTSLSVSSVEVFDKENILFSNSHGLFRYNIKTREFWLYDENSGLPSNTITGRGIFIDHRNKLWVGTSFGIALAQEPITISSPTVKPYCVDARVNGNSVLFNQGVNAPYGAFLNLQFSSITFPENKINLQWRMEGNSSDTLWHTIANHQVNLADLSAGRHVLHVRAKKNTGLGWSEPTMMQINIGKPFWQRAEFFFFVLTIVLIIAWLSNSVTTRVLNRRKEVLHQLIDERTQDLQKANEELTIRNSELDRFVYSASHDLSAPLKSILGLISVSRMESPGDQQLQYLTMMEASVRKLEDFIKDVVSYSRNTRLPVKRETFSFYDLVKDLLDDHQYSPNFSNIKFEISQSVNETMTSDIMRLRIILNNLISNAMKFHRFDGNEIPFIRISLQHQENAYVITVQDNGLGIDEQHTSRIFEMFYRASEQAQGSGLGLYILKESVLKMSGRVTVKSTLEVGTIFTITLPK